MSKKLFLSIGNYIIVFAKKWSLRFRPWDGRRRSKLDLLRGRKPARGWFVQITGLVVICLLALVDPVQAKLSKKERAKLQDSLKVAAEKFGKAYVERNFKKMYEMLDSKYRHRVELWEYKDFVHYDGIIDGFMKVEVMDVIVFPPKSGNSLVYGKVSQRIFSVETVKTKSTGHTDKMEEEYIYWDDWVNKKGTWQKIERLE